MYIRPATRADVPILGHISAEAFANEPIYEHLCPWRFEHPADFRRYFEDEIRISLATPGHLVMVAVEDHNNQLHGIKENSPQETEDRVVAYATFERYGSPAECANWNPDSISKKITRIIYALSAVWNSFVFPNRAISLSAIREYGIQASAIREQHIEGIPGRIEFDTFAVHPDYQRSGYGEKLIGYAGIRAREENLVVFGDVTLRLLPLYLKIGGEKIGRIELQKEKKKLTDESGSATVLDILEVVVMKWKV